MARQNEIKKNKEDEKRQRMARVEMRELRQRLETIPELTRKAQAVFNRFIRMRDKNKPCISCGKPNDGTANTFDAGHYRSVGSASHLRFNEKNVHAQCKHCNQYLSGNVVSYRRGLIERIGLKEVENLESDNAPRKWDKEELRELTRIYRQKLKELRERHE